MLRVSIKLKFNRNAYVNPPIATYLYTTAYGNGFYTKQTAIILKSTTLRDSEIAALDAITKPLQKEHTIFPISVGGIPGHFEHCQKVLYDFGFRKILSHTVTEKEDWILYRAYRLSLNNGVVGYDTETERHEEDPFGVF